MWRLIIGLVRFDWLFCVCFLSWSVISFSGCSEPRYVIGVRKRTRWVKVLGAINEPCRLVNAGLSTGEPRKRYPTFWSSGFVRKKRSSSLEKVGDFYCLYDVFKKAPGRLEPFKFSLSSSIGFCLGLNEITKRVSSTLREQQLVPIDLSMNI